MRTYKGNPFDQPENLPCDMADVGNPVKNAISIINKEDEKHIIYQINGKVKQAYKRWSFEKCELVLKRLGVKYWEIG